MFDCRFGAVAVTDRGPAGLADPVAQLRICRKQPHPRAAWPMSGSAQIAPTRYTSEAPSSNAWSSLVISVRR